MCVMTWKGTDPSLSSILLNSHMDVVTAMRASWNTDPFVAVEHDGWIQCRGTQGDTHHQCFSLSHTKC